MTRLGPPRPLRTGFVHSRPELLYFWIYFVIVNAIWIVVPGLCILHAWRKLSGAVAASGARGGKAKRG